jgi:peptidoglycan/LPS O-acetylase OafA/YrhL
LWNLFHHDAWQSGEMAAVLSMKVGPMQIGQSPSAERLPYLDGLRGCAALVVLAGHLVTMVWPALVVTEIHPSTMPGWQVAVAASPLSVLWDGRLAVSIFFILSGYVLTTAMIARPISLPALAGKRYIRLLLPVLVATLPTLLLQPHGFYFNHELAFVTGSDWLNGVTAIGFHPTIFGWLRNAVWTVFFIDGQTSYNSLLWTMRFEWFGSLLIFLIVCLLRSAGWRLLLALPLSLLLADVPVYAFLHLFLIGMILHDLAPLLVPRPSRAKVPMIVLDGLGMALVAVGLYLPRLVMVVIDRHASAFHFLLWLRLALPSWQGDRWMLAAIPVVTGVTLSPRLRHWLSRPTCLFLGRISFPLYLFHLPILLSFGSWLMLFLLPRLGLTAAAWSTFVVAAVITISIAWLMTLLVEHPTLRLSAWLGLKIDALGMRLRPRSRKSMRSRVA